MLSLVYIMISLCRCQNDKHIAFYVVWSSKENKDINICLHIQQA